MKIITVVGARPQFIKAATVSRVIKDMGDIQEILVHTGQHYDNNMSDIFFEELDLEKPNYHLGIGSGCHGAQTGEMLKQIEEVLISEKPDWVLVYGDTNSTLAGTLAAVKLHIPVAHVEAGLRSFNRRMPEEINRVLSDHASSLLFPPTEAAVANLRAEGIPEDRIRLVGDVMYDAAIYYGEKAEGLSCIIEDLKIEPQKYVLATVHRAENTDSPQRLKAIMGGLISVAEKIPVVFPIHPRTRKFLENSGQFDEVQKKLILIDPVGYLDMIMLEKRAVLVATDSGGVQKETFFHKVPCVTLRDETEWVELVDLGWNRIVPPLSEKCVTEAILAIVAESCGQQGSPYGNGTAARKIVDCLINM